MRSGCPHPSARLALALGLVLAGCSPLSAAAAAPFKRDQTPLPAGIAGTGGNAHAATSAGSSGGAAVRMLLGLAIVLAIIFVLYKVLKRSAGKNDRAIRAHGEMTVVATTPLAHSRALHLVRVGDELVLVGSSEQGVSRIRVYGPDDVRRLGFDGRNDLPSLPPSPSGRPSFGAALLETLRKRTAR
jgi:flagellar biogenesis protein FliO